MLLLNLYLHMMLISYGHHMHIIVICLLSLLQIQKEDPGRRLWRWFSPSNSQSKAPD